MSQLFYLKGNGGTSKAQKRLYSKMKAMANHASYADYNEANGMKEGLELIKKFYHYD